MMCLGIPVSRKTSSRDWGLTCALALPKPLYPNMLEAHPNAIMGSASTLALLFGNPLHVGPAPKKNNKKD